MSDSLVWGHSVQRLREFLPYSRVVIFSGLASLLSFVTAAILAREVGPSGFGEFALFFSLLQIFWTATNFGDASYVRFANTSEDENVSSYLRAAFAIELGTVSLLALLSYPLAYVLASFVFRDQSLTGTVLLGILSGTALSLISLVAAVHQAKEDYKRYTRLNILFYGTVTAAVIALAVFQETLTLGAVYVTYVGAAFVIFSASALHLMRKTRPWRLERRLIPSMLSFSKWLVAENVAYLIYQRLDILLLARYLSEAEVGQYGVALRVTVAASLLTGSLAPFLLPKAVRTRGTRLSLSDYLRKTAPLMIAVVIFIALLWIAAPVLVRVLFGEDFARAAVLVRVLLIASAAIAIYTPLSQLFMAQDDPRRRLFLGLLKLILIPTLLVVLIPRLGSVGAAWALASSEVAALAYVVAALLPSLRNNGARALGTSVE